MGIKSVNFKSPAKRTASKNHLWQRTYGLALVVETDDPMTGPVEVMNAIDPVTGFRVPLIGSTYFVNLAESDLGAFLQSISVAEDDDGSGQQWTVTLEYGPYDAAQFNGSDPTSWAIKVTHSSQKYERVIWFDQNGDAIRNSAKEPFADPITVDDSRSIITVERNELVSAFSLTLAEQYRDKINNAPWNGFATKTVKCDSITTSAPQFDSDNRVWYYTVTYVFAVNRDTWVKKLLDQGFAVLDSSSPPRPKPVMNEGHPVSDPVPLDGSGHRLASTATPVTLSFDVYPSADFSVFNIDLSTRLGA